MSTSPGSTNKSRLPRYRRAEEPPRMRVMPRDVDIVAWLLECGFLTRAQIEQLLFRPDKGQDHPTKGSIALRRLRLLYHHRYVQRLEKPVAAGHGSGPMVYFLDRRGARLLESTRGLEDVRWERGGERSLLFLDHTLAINDVRIAVWLATQQGDIVLEEWLSERDLVRRGLKATVNEPKSGKPLPVRPDAYFVLSRGGKRASFFLELDQATMPRVRWARKIRALLAYWRSGRYEAEYGNRSLRVLTVTTTKDRLEHLVQWTAEEGGGELFWFTLQEEVIAEHMVTEPVWRVAGWPGAHPLW